MTTDTEHKEKYYVVKNQEEQYSIWPDFKTIPPGWEQVKEPMQKKKCLEYIDTVWTDMRPLSLRKKMDKFKCNKKRTTQ